MSDRWDRLPADIFLEILRRLPPSPRQRLRLVCRHWRSVIDDRTPATQARAMVLAFVNDGRGGRRAHVLDDLTKHGAGRGRELKLPRGAGEQGVSMVGTCNGLLCLRRWRGDFVVVNPVTGEKLAVPPPSMSPEVSMGTTTAAYSLVYHPATWEYKIMHVSCFGAVKVFTLGVGHGGRCRCPSSGIATSRRTRLCLASVGGVAYWVAADFHSVMSLDLKDERVVFVAKLPVRVGLVDLSWHLTTDLHGRLIFVICSNELKRGKTLKRTKMWMLDDGRRNKTRPEWVLRCKLVESEQELPHGIAWPHVTHGEHILTTRQMGWMYRVSLHACLLSKARKKRGRVVRVEGSPSIAMYDNCYSLRTFAYVETTEPLALYGGNDCNISNSEGWDWRFDDGEHDLRITPTYPLIKWYCFDPDVRWWKKKVDAVTHRSSLANLSIPPFLPPTVFYHHHSSKAPTSLFSLLLELLCPPAVLLAMLECRAPLHHGAANASLQTSSPRGRNSSPMVAPGVAPPVPYGWLRRRTAVPPSPPRPPN
ncbi:hypothetical protein HU200_012298 [Digitaria exilis]|uniref:F-box domain-containing protein n=1 Tax=Digitaria exilis TaxID=1010633 RepID=A0A835FEW2_9POAL|nr:hypothetical protein HU200_012298 [Digitaria exilis]